jgi:hypothetical protein
MEEAARNKKIDDLIKEVRKQLFSLTSAVLTAKIELRLEINMSQKTIGDIYITTNSREKYYGNS